MDRETSNQENPSLLPNNNTKEESPRKLHGGSVGGSSNDRLKRDEWSEGAVSCLLEAYESKWVLRNRAKLKGQDWEEVARYVSARVNCTRSPKTQTQCKNKIESMKKRYRSESATADGSSWPLYSRLDLLLRGSAPPPPQPQPPQIVMLPSSTNPPPLIILEPSPIVQPQPPPAAPQILGTAPNSHGSNGIDRGLAKDDGTGTKLSNHLSDKIAIDTDSSTPALYSEKEKLTSKKLKTKSKRRKKEDWEIAESIRWLAEAVLKSEQARIETMREIERMRVEAEAKRGEMEVKRTEIIANTQLEIARLFAGVSSKGNIDPSLRIGRS
ncbi:hypothetical protein SLE2022_066240 [Rubroshorea leprosula]